MAHHTDTRDDLRLPVMTAPSARSAFPWLSVLACFCNGAALEVGVTRWTGARESWDRPEYVLMLAAFGVTAIVHAWSHPFRPVPGGVAVVLGHLVMMFLRSSGTASMWPIGLVLSLPVVAGAALLGWIVGRLRRMARQRDDDADRDPE
jgi:hypothetical protein